MERNQMKADIPKLFQLKYLFQISVFAVGVKHGRDMIVHCL
jgi:hypothetical protein